MSLLGSQVTTSPEPERDPGLFRILSDHLSLQSLVPRSDTVVDTVHELIGGFNPPREFVFMDRAAIGLGGVFLRLQAQINWHRLFHELIAGFDVKALAKRQAKALKAAGLPPAG